MNNLTLNVTSFLSEQEVPPPSSIPSNLTQLINSTTNQVLPMATHDPLPIIIITLCLFLLFGGCVACLAVFCSGDPPEEGWEMSGCAPGEGLSCGAPASSEPQLKLWKRLDSMRRSLSSSSSSSSSVRRSAPQRRMPMSPPLITVTPPPVSGSTPETERLRPSPQTRTTASGTPSESQKLCPSPYMPITGTPEMERCRSPPPTHATTPTSERLCPTDTRPDIPPGTKLEKEKLYSSTPTHITIGTTQIAMPCILQYATEI